MKHKINLLNWLTAFLLIPAVAFADEEICGDGIDNDSSGGDLACPWDSDDDGYTTTDCDNTNRYIIPGAITTSGCSGGQVRKCGTDGTFGSCKNVSSLGTSDAPAGTTAVYFLSTGVPSNTCSGDGSHGNPWGLNCIANTGAVGYHAPVPGDAYFVINGGTHDGATWGSSPPKAIFISNKDGTLANPISLIGIDYPVIKGSTVYPTEVIPVYLSDSSYWNIQGLDIDGTGSFMNAGIFLVSGSTYADIQRNFVRNVDGLCGTTNLGGIKIAGGSNYVNVHHNKVFDNYTRGNTCLGGTPGNRNENNYQIIFMDIGPITAQYNVVYTTHPEGAGHLLAVKHGCRGSQCAVATADISYNKLLGGSYFSDFAMATKNARFHHNIINAIRKGTAGRPLEARDLGGNPQYDSMEFDHNTIINGPFMVTIFDLGYKPFGNIIANWHHNVVVDNRAGTYPNDASDGFWGYYHYGSDEAYTEGFGKLLVDNNCYHNSNGIPLWFSVFANVGSTTTGAEYTSFAALQAGSAGLPEGSTWEPNSFSENPTFDAYYRATSTNCADKGYSVAGSSEPPPSGPEPTLSAGQVPLSGKLNFGKGRR